jgi:cytochrome c5
MIKPIATASGFATNKFQSSSKCDAVFWRWIFGIGYAFALASITASAAAVDADKFPDIAIDVFQGMDAPLQFDSAKPGDLAAIKGRNTWLLWTAGDQEFWDLAARNSHGLIDLLKTLDSRKRGTRFHEMGLINEPGFQQAASADEFGIWLDQRGEPEATAIDPAVYGRSSGVIGFRIFSNPAFDQKAREQWCAERYYNDEVYAANPALVRPYRVGVTCAACHVAPHPLRPPVDSEKPDWENLVSAIGNQYIREGRVFAQGARVGSFFRELLEAQSPGTSDTSRIATDNINNPSAINSLFLIPERLRIAHIEELSGETLLLAQTRRKMPVPRVLKDGADSVGFVGACLRVYVNLGLYHEHWLQQHNALLGLTPQKPFSISVAQRQSTYWRATETKIGNVLAFLSRIQPMRLRDAPGGADYITKDESTLEHGRTLFAQNCASCHSSKQPPSDVGNRAAWFHREIIKPAFLSENFLSDDERHPITIIRTNAARACATNAMRGHISQFFSSDTYKSLPSPGAIKVWNPYSNQNEKFCIPSGGPGFYRTPSLISVWASAPLLHNNSLGTFTGDPSVKGRIAAFNDAIEKLLWPEKRLGLKSIWRTQAASDLLIPGDAMPRNLQALLANRLDAEGNLRLGPIPPNTPINLLANIDLQTDSKRLAALIQRISAVMEHISAEKLDSDATTNLMRRELAPLLFKLSKCPDFVEDRGHYFGVDLTDEDKRSLIEFLKTL